MVFPSKVRKILGTSTRKRGEPKPMQQAIFELVINLRTAKTLGLMIPQSVLQRATEAIQ